MGFQIMEGRGRVSELELMSRIWGTKVGAGDLLKWAGEGFWPGGRISEPRVWGLGMSYKPWGNYLGAKKDLELGGRELVRGSRSCWALSLV